MFFIYLKSSAVSVSSQQMLPHVHTIPSGAQLKSLPVNLTTDIEKQTLTVPVGLLSTVTRLSQGSSPYSVNLVCNIFNAHISGSCFYPV